MPFYDLRWREELAFNWGSAHHPLAGFIHYIHHRPMCLF